jgi:hypothetical protein
MAFKMKYKKGNFPFKKTIAKRNFEKEIGEDDNELAILPKPPRSRSGKDEVKFLSEFVNDGSIQPGVHENLHNALMQELKNKKEK